jgi:hypothetical protein
VQNGVLTATKGDGWLATDRDYGDFELELEYRLPPGGNTGVFLRVPANADPSGKGLLEVQAIDDTFPQFQNVPDRNRTGAVVGLFAASPRADAPPNAWNKLSIHAVGPRITVVVNGRKVSEGSLADQPQAALTPEMQLPAGRIGLQCRPATGVEFRNIRIRELSAGTASTTPPDNGWSDLFNGADLTEWQPMETLGAGGDQHRPTTGGWEVRSGELACTTDQAGWLKSTAQYADFELEADFKVPAGGNSDIYIRCPVDGRLSKAGMAIQIIDEHSGKFSMEPKNRPGAIWGAVGHDVASVTRPLGEWNSVSIRCEGDRVQVAINGQQTVDANMQAVPELRDRPRSGFIGIANWGGEAKGVAFRNIRIRKLP